MNLPAFGSMTTSLRQIGSRPWLAAGVGLGIAATPFFAKNKERGYFSTASITTPLIAGGAIAGMQIYNGYQAAKPQIHAAFRTNYFESVPVNPPPGALAKMAENRTSSLLILDSTASEFYASAGKAPFQFERHQKEVSDLFDELSAIDGKETLLSNSFQNAMLTSMTPHEANPEPDLGQARTLLSKEEMQAILKDADGLPTRWTQDESFLKTLNANLSKASKLWDSGDSLLAAKGETSAVERFALRPDGKAWNALMR